jgi:hypothetical protein
MTKKINLPCNGDGGNNSISKVADTITFETSGGCLFTSFNFTGGTGDPYYPPGFSNKSPSDGTGESVSYSYDGTAIPEAGYPFDYTVTTPKRGNGSGTIKNTGGGS